MLVDDLHVFLILILESQTGVAPLLMWLTLALALYLTVIELRELRPHYLWWFWWLIFVFLTHFVGYLFLRAYAVYRRWNLGRG